MIGAIPNPKKSITIDFPIQKVKDNLVYLPLLKDRKYKFTSKNDVLNLFTFEASETLSLGVYIDLSLSEQSENKTSIEIEIRRKVGSFDKAHEVSNANIHIQKVLELIGICVTLNDEQKENIRKENKIEKMEGHLEKVEGMKKYNCGICKKEFYADSSKSLVWNCPHCKSSNAIPASGGCLGVISWIVILASSSVFALTIILK